MRYAILLLCAAALVAQEPPKTARVEGVVTSTSGEPVAGVRVRLVVAVVQGAAFEITSDDAGKFSIEGVTPGGDYALQAIKPGFVTARYPVLLELGAGETLKDVTLTMVAQPTITGTVVDSFGEPVPGVRVSAQQNGYVRGEKTLASVATATTDDRGVFRLANVLSGRYILVATPATETGAATAPLTTYYPNSLDLGGAGIMSVADGEQVTGVQIQLRRGAVFNVSGTLLNAEGKPAAGALMLSVPQAGEAGLMGQVLNMMQAISGLTATAAQGGILPTGADGKFTLRGMPAGSYSIMAVAPPRTAAATIRITDKSIEGLVLRMENAATLSGIVRLEGGELAELLPNSGVTTGGGSISVGLRQSAGSFALGSPRGQVSRDGTFKLENVAALPYQLTVGSLPENTYLKSANFAGKDLLGTPLLLDPDTSGEIEIVLKRGTASVSASVANDQGKPQVGMLVALWSEVAMSGLVRNGVVTGTTGPKGTVEFKGLRPGLYRAAAFNTVDSGLAEARDFLKLLEADAVKLELSEGAALTQALKVIPAEKLKAAEEKLP